MNPNENISENNQNILWKDRFRKTLHYWFVQYNPLYFFSAFCVIFGVFLVSQGLKNADWKQGQIFLTGVIEAYQITLLAGALILFRIAKDYRPAVILGLLTVFFLFDCTFQTETVAIIKPVGFIISTGWIILLILKLIALILIFQLKISAEILIIPVIAGIIIAGTPHLIALKPVYKTGIHLAATWSGLVLWCIRVWTKPEIKCSISLDEWGQTVLRRAVKSAWFIWAGFYLYHLIAWFNMFEIRIISAHVTGFLVLFALLTDKESGVWFWCAFAGYIAFTNLPTGDISLFIAGIVFCFQAWSLKQNRLYLGAAIAFYIGLRIIIWKGFYFPAPKLWVDLISALILFLIGWSLKVPSAFAVLIAGIFFYAIKYIPSYTPFQWGILLLITGFAALIAGIFINWKLSSRK